MSGFHLKDGKSEWREDLAGLSDPYRGGYRPAVQVDLSQINGDRALRQHYDAAQSFYQYGIAKCRHCSLLYKKDPNGWNGISPACDCEAKDAQNSRYAGTAGQYANAQNWRAHAISEHKKAIATADTDKIERKPEVQGWSWTVWALIFSAAAWAATIVYLWLA